MTNTGHTHYKTRTSRTGRYLLVACALAAFISVAFFFWHFRSTGSTLHCYVSEGAESLERMGTPFTMAGAALRSLLLDGGLVEDPIEKYPPDLTTELPNWRGLGANALRKDTAPRYKPDGYPIATTDESLWEEIKPPITRRVRVDSVEALIDGVSHASPGDQIVLMAGRYRLNEPLRLSAEGSRERPIVLRGEQIGEVVLELSRDAWLEARGAFWAVSDMIVRGQCNDPECPRLIFAYPGASAFTVRNLFVSGVAALIEIATNEQPRIPGLIDGVTLIGSQPPAAPSTWTEQAIRRITTPPSKQQFIILCARQDPDPSCDTQDLSLATKKIADGGLLLIRTGTYRQAEVIDKKGIHILAEPGAHLRGSSIQGKGALVINNDITIEGLECSEIRVPDGNGCCVRQQKGDMTLVGVHFHHSEMGVLTGHRGGNIRILDSYIHDSGYKETGQLGHNVYVNSGTLEFSRSWSLAARNAGHELKSRAARTSINKSLLASLNARDSRLVDVPWGGVLEIHDSMLGEGPRSENHDLIGYGLELADGSPKHPENIISIKRNTIYLDSPRRGNIINYRHAKRVEIIGNTIIGEYEKVPGNRSYTDREKARLGPYPEMMHQAF